MYIEKRGQATFLKVACPLYVLIQPSIIPLFRYYIRYILPFSFIKRTINSL